MNLFLRIACYLTLSAFAGCVHNLGGTIVSIPQGGTGTSTAPTSQVLYGGANHAYLSTPTTSVSCTGSDSCSAFIVLGGSPSTITGSGVSDPFTHVSVWGQSTSATSTLIALTGSPESLVASSTAVFTSASSTQFTANTLYLSGKAPTLGTCGTATISATSSDQRGNIVVTAGTPTTCNLVFSSAKPDTPACVTTTNSVTLLSDVAAASTTGVQFGMSAGFSGRITYICLL